ncbi:lysophospholipase [Malassezia nana]|uniref:Acyl-protein thioesterase 1 n=1 Tax=Malassezia nana TaxID=180528 RepID=A0AAF0J259_9BASI|nr:lysophospholipase [Malassezia nana]
MATVHALKTLVVPPAAGGFPSATVFLLHGLGDTAQGWVDVARMLGRQQALQHIRFVLPTAPIQPVSVNMGMKMTSWFDLYSLTSLEEGEDEAGMLRSVEAVRGLVQQEVDGSAPGLNGHKVPMNRIVLAGFSQGGAISLLLGLTQTEPLAGIAALSTWLPLHAKIQSMRPPTSAPFPLFQAHGTVDQIVDYQFGKRTFSFLQDELGFHSQAEWHEYRMPHSACPEEIRDLGAWLERVLPI